MDKKIIEDTTVSICKGMTLEIKEVRGTSTMYSPKEGYEEVSANTRTYFHWKLRGLASKLGAEELKSSYVDIEKQELYEVEFKSSAYDIGFVRGFKTREEAITNAIGFAGKNGIEVDGYQTH